MNTARRGIGAARRGLLAALSFGLSTSAFSIQAETVNVAVAANFIKPMNEIAEQFFQSTGHRAILSFGSSGKLYAQIRNGAPFEVFLSADQSKPNALVQQGLAVEGSQFTCARGTLVLWSAKPNQLMNDVDYKTNSAADILKQGQFNKLAIANPQLAPYGKAALEALDHLGLKETIKPKLVQGQNIAQTYQFVSSGNAQLGLIAKSQVTETDSTYNHFFWAIPKNLYSPIRQDAVLLRTGKDSTAAKALMDYLRSAKSKAIINRFGYNSEP
ncbi:MAG: molybdate ABC transporter substrate-binding protein [Pseudomonadales bacterium]|nr:molybdate ABC transporter substrate-binding protein [Pseudomonadales bacterium]